MFTHVVEAMRCPAKLIAINRATTLLNTKLLLFLSPWIWDSGPSSKAAAFYVFRTNTKYEEWSGWCVSDSMKNGGLALSNALPHCRFHNDCWHSLTCLKDVCDGVKSFLLPQAPLLSFTEASSVVPVTFTSSSRSSSAAKFNHKPQFSARLFSVAKRRDR